MAHLLTAMPGGIARLLAIARRITAVLTWLAVAALVAALVLARKAAEGNEPLSTVVIALLFAIPPLILLHFVVLVRLVRLRVGLAVRGSMLRSLLAARMLSLAPLLHPGYWLLLAAAVVACLAMIPLAALVALFG